MAENLPPVDVVVIGTGAGGGTAVWPLANAGLKVVAIEAGPRVTTRDFPFHEVRNDVRDSMAKWKANWEVPTVRLNTSAVATRPVGATGPMMNAVGGTSIHWMTQSWRYTPYNFKHISMSTQRYGAGAIPKDSTSIDWPFDYAEIEPYYDKHEYFAGVSGQAGNVKGVIDKRGNVLEGPRARPYPLPAMRDTGFTEMMTTAARAQHWNPYPGQAGIRSKAYHGKAGCTYCGFCGWTGCYTNAKVSTNVDYIPAAEKTKNLTIVPMANATSIEVDSQGRASGVVYLKGGREYFQPAKLVVLAAYTYENSRMLLLSTSKAFPNGLSNNHGQVGGTTSRTGLARRARLAGFRASDSTATQEHSVNSRRSMTLTATTSTTQASVSSAAACAAPRWRRSRSVPRIRPRRASRGGDLHGRNGWRRTLLGRRRWITA